MAIAVKVLVIDPMRKTVSSVIGLFVLACVGFSGRRPHHLCSLSPTAGSGPTTFGRDIRGAS
jgi:hypothetical protein